MAEKHEPIEFIGALSDHIHELERLEEIFERVALKPGVMDAFNHSAAVFGSPAKAMIFWTRSHSILDQKSPLSLLEEDAGREEALKKIRSILGSLEHGLPV